jgi:hypothetical protein
MANNKRLAEVRKATQFSGDNQPPNRGRKPSVLKFIKDGGLSITDVKRLLGSLIWDYDAKELAALLKDKENPVPMGMALILGALAKDLKNKNLVNLKEIWDRVYGKSTQSMDIQASGSIGVIDMTPEERIKRINELLKEAKKRAKEPGNGLKDADG